MTRGQIGRCFGIERMKMYLISSNVSNFENCKKLNYFTLVGRWSVLRGNRGNKSCDTTPLSKKAKCWYYNISFSKMPLTLIITAFFWPPFSSRNAAVDFYSSSASHKKKNSSIQILVCYPMKLNCFIVLFMHRKMHLKKLM